MMMIRCKNCNENQESTEYNWISRGKENKMVLNSRTCRKCSNHNQNVVARLKKENPKPENSKCACCGDVAKLVCDHNHNNDEFRGWLCEPCNTGIGKLGDDMDGLRRAMAYLMKVAKKRPSFAKLERLYAGMGYEVRGEEC